VIVPIDFYCFGVSLLRDTSHGSPHTESQHVLVQDQRGQRGFLEQGDFPMKMTFVSAAFATLLLAGPAFADCAADLTRVEEAMKTVKLDEAMTTKAKTLMEQAVTARDAKDEATCATSATELKSLVGLR
jgi:hypothetical protein